MRTVKVTVLLELFDDASEEDVEELKDAFENFATNRLVSSTRCGQKIETADVEIKDGNWSHEPGADE